MCDGHIDLFAKKSRIIREKTTRSTLPAAFRTHDTFMDSSKRQRLDHKIKLHVLWSSGRCEEILVSEDAEVVEVKVAAQKLFGCFLRIFGWQYQCRGKCCMGVKRV